MRIKLQIIVQILMVTTVMLFVGCVTNHESSTKNDSHWNSIQAQMMNDGDSLISSEFNIPDSLKQRVSFWMAIYGRYDSNHKVIHDSKFPWIVYEVINIKNYSKPGTHIANRVNYYRKIIKKVAKKKKNLSRNEKQFISLFKDYPQYIKKAHRSIRYQTGQKDHIKSGIERSMNYLSHMEDIFRARNLPTELTRLPFVESSFNWKAHSKVGARGIWQFMPGTGKKFMKINRYIDERVSPLKSTHAAAKLLKQNHRILYKEWPLALTAYNHGPGGVRKAVKKMGTKDMGLIANTYKSRRFSFASANFYSSFLGALYVEKYKDIVFKDITYKAAPRLLVEKTKRRTRAKTIFKKTKLSEEDFLTWNPELKKALKRNYRIPKNYIYYKPERSQGLAYKDSTSE